MILLIDERLPGLVMVDGKDVRLQRMQYSLLWLLAARPGECVPYAEIYDALWGDRIVEYNQMHFQKRKLLERIRAVCPERGDIVRAVAGKGFVLDLAREEVEVLADGMGNQSLAAMDGVEDSA